MQEVANGGGVVDLSSTSRSEQGFRCGVSAKCHISLYEAVTNCGSSVFCPSHTFCAGRVHDVYVICNMKYTCDILYDILKHQVSSKIAVTNDYQTDFWEFSTVEV